MFLVGINYKESTWERPPAPRLTTVIGHSQSLTDSGLSRCWEASRTPSLTPGSGVSPKPRLCLQTPSSETSSGTTMPLPGLDGAPAAANHAGRSALTAAWPSGEAGGGETGSPAPLSYPCPPQLPFPHSGDSRPCTPDISTLIQDRPACRLMGHHTE